MALTNSCTMHQRKPNWKKVKARMKVVAAVVIVIMLITPLRNSLVPFVYWDWPNVWNELHSVRLFWILLTDLFYYIDRTPYTGSCAHIHPHLEPLNKLHVERFVSYSEEDFYAAVERVKARYSQEDLWKLDHFKPSLTPEEQREMRYSLLTLTSALDLFNVTYFVACGTLIGAHRHHGFIPWDDDADILIKASEWELAREVLSCVPDFSLNMGRDYMWKFMWNKSKFWKWEDFIRFPFIDIFPYNEDDNHVWPLTIWMKWEVLWRKQDIFPPSRLPLEGYEVNVPHNPGRTLSNNFGDVRAVCASRKYKRKERQSFPHKERVMVPCSMLYGIYPFVFEKNVSGTERPVQQLRLGERVLSEYTPHTS
ncbi:hypothetical protein BaRGS_00029903 [Batillaria attramentaria]|uniref:LicD/FKTN/FKRP nucleotidyltransferase domain-containing protein n=1 Tax=Batillaria attramentaria TaxID=370345 RepID=A0ABD0JUQ8_9CAEN